MLHVYSKIKYLNYPQNLVLIHFFVKKILGLDRIGLAAVQYTKHTCMHDENHQYEGTSKLPGQFSVSFIMLHPLRVGMQFLLNIAKKTNKNINHNSLQNHHSQINFKFVLQTTNTYQSFSKYQVNSIFPSLCLACENVFSAADLVPQWAYCTLQMEFLS